MQIEDAISQGLQLLFMNGLPVIAAAAVAGTLVAALQAVTTVQESVIGYAARVLAVILTMAVLLPSLGRGLVEFTQRILE